MLRRRNINNVRQRAARFILEALEERVELSAAGGAAQVVAEASAVGSRLQAKFARLDAFVIAQTAQLNQEDVAAVNQEGLTYDGETSGIFNRAPTVLQIQHDYKTFVRTVDRRVNALTSQAGRAINRVSARSSRIDPARGAAIAADSSQLRGTVAAIGGNLKEEASAARAAGERLVGQAHAVIYQAALHGLSTTAQVNASDAGLIKIRRSQQTRDQAAASALTVTYHNTYDALQSQIAALPSGSLGTPPP